MCGCVAHPLSKSLLMWTVYKSMHHPHLMLMTVQRILSPFSEHYDNRLLKLLAYIHRHKAPPVNIMFVRRGRGNYWKSSRKESIHMIRRYIYPTLRSFRRYAYLVKATARNRAIEYCRYRIYLITMLVSLIKFVQVRDARKIYRLIL